MHTKITVCFLFSVRIYFDTGFEKYCSVLFYQVLSEGDGLEFLI